MDLQITAPLASLFFLTKFVTFERDMSDDSGTHTHQHTRSESMSGIKCTRFRPNQILKFKMIRSVIIAAVAPRTHI